MTDIELPDVVVSFVFLVLLWFDLILLCALVPLLWNGNVYPELFYVRSVYLVF